MKFKGLRIITNLHCNQHCKFCYQSKKDKMLLSLGVLHYETRGYVNKSFEYCTIMGGESTVLPDQTLLSFISAGVRLSKQTRLTTNGSLLTPKRMGLWHSYGLNGVNISIPAIGNLYQKITRSKMTFEDARQKVAAAKQVFGAENVRINVPMCAENIRGKEIEEMLWFFLHVMSVKVTLCEDLHATYSIRSNPERFGLKQISDSGFGLVMMDFHGKDVAIYAHKDNYKNTDLIVSPVGIFHAWDGYCKAIGYKSKTLADAIIKARGVNSPPTIPITFD